MGFCSPRLSACGGGYSGRSIWRSPFRLPQRSRSCGARHTPVLYWGERLGTNSLLMESLRVSSPKSRERKMEPLSVLRTSPWGEPVAYDLPACPIYDGDQGGPTVPAAEDPGGVCTPEHIRPLGGGALDRRGTGKPGGPSPELTTPTLELHDAVHLLDLHPHPLFEPQMGPDPAVTEGLVLPDDGLHPGSQLLVYPGLPGLYGPFSTFVIGGTVHPQGRADGLKGIALFPQPLEFLLPCPISSSFFKISHSMVSWPTLRSSSLILASFSLKSLSHRTWLTQPHPPPEGGQGLLPPSA